MTLLIVPTTTVSATIHPDVSTGSWFVYDSSIIVKPSFGIFEFAFDAQFKITITGITNDTVNTSVEVIHNTLPLNITDILLPLIIIPTEALVNDSFVIDNMTIPFITTTETDASKYWRGVPVKTLDLATIGDIFGGADLTMGAKFDAVTGVLYQIFASATLDIAGGIGLSISLDVSLTEADISYRESMLSRYDHSYDTQFMWNDFWTAPWLIPTIILSVVMIVLVLVVGSTKRQVGKPITTKTGAMTRQQQQRSRMKSGAKKK